MQAVITGDLIDSTIYTPQELDHILNTLNKEFKSVENQENVEFKIFRGDSFQGIALDAATSLAVVLQLKSAINRLENENPKISGLTDFRIAIGIGTVNLKRASILESNGEAFQFSGRTLDTMKGDYPRLLLKTSETAINEEFKVSFSLLDSVLSKWSRASAEVVYYLLKGLKEKEIAKHLGINQSAVNHRKKAANWDAIALLLKRYDTVISKFTAHGD